MSEQATQFPDEITVSVTEKHIQHGRRVHCSECPVALAITSALPHAAVSVGASSFSLSTGMEWARYTIPDIVQGFITRFDSGGNIDPFVFTTRRMQ